MQQRTGKENKKNIVTDKEIKKRKRKNKEWKLKTWN